jgi:hypothetical protein
MKMEEEMRSCGEEEENRNKKKRGQDGKERGGKRRPEKKKKSGKCGLKSQPRKQWAWAKKEGRRREKKEKIKF